MHFSDLPKITGGQIVALNKDRPITHLLNDSRKPVIQEGTIFFAIVGERNNGHDYIASLYGLGVRQFLVEEAYSLQHIPEANVLRVDSSIAALQGIVTHHRQKFSIPVIGITGSNGKTIIKEWLFQLLNSDYNIIKSPGSYNSQIGVPLSVWHMKSHHQLGIFEAGISKPGEMIRLQKIIQPDWGIFSNIGTAHDESFVSHESKVTEKLSLFSKVSRLVYCTDHLLIHRTVKESGIPSLSWGKRNADVFVSANSNVVRVQWKNHDFSIKFKFSDAASIENAIHCVVLMLGLGYTPEVINQRVQGLHAIAMRLELKEGINQTQLIDDTYNNDLVGLRISLDFLAHQKQRKKKSLILSDILQSGLATSKITQEIADLVNESKISKFIGIGPTLVSNSKVFKVPSIFYNSTEEFLAQLKSEDFNNEIVLIKGARIYRFERIIKLLEKKVHGTVMEINLGALAHNLNYFKSKLSAGTKIMVMVKALAYGSGSIQIANLLQYHQVDYLGVAYADEGVDLRLHNITIPIMVMNPSRVGFDSILQYHLEPEIFSFKILNELISFLEGRQISIHLKLDTGMHRLGFQLEEVDHLISILKEHANLKVASIFSHLAAADDKQHDEYSTFQVDSFLKAAQKIKEVLSINPLLHILNTSGILRFPQYHFDMVRLGIGLYGVDPTSSSTLIRPVVTMKTVISQIKSVKKGNSIGYSRKGIATDNMRIATIAIGYADGFSRAFSQGVGCVLVHGKKAPVVGNVCMDMTMVDITGIEANEGDEVILYGEGLSVREVAASINTIPYEILTSTSDRVRRIFIAEGI